MRSSGSRLSGSMCRLLIRLRGWLQRHCDSYRRLIDSHVSTLAIVLHGSRSRSTRIVGVAVWTSSDPMMMRFDMRIG